MNLTQLLHRNVLLRPDQEAVCYQDTSLTYRELEKRVACLAGGLLNIGIKEGECLPLLSMNSSRYLEYLFAVPWAGAAYNLVNVRWSVAEIAYSLVDSGARFLVVDDTFASIVSEIKQKVPMLESVIYAGDGECPEGMLSYEKLLAEAEPIEDTYRSGDDLAGVFYTGGTTGSPKGVMLSHTNLMTFASSGALMSGLSAQPRWLNCAPLFHIAGLGMLLMSFLLGGSQIIVPAFIPADVIKTIREQSVTDMLLVPTMVQMLLDFPDFDVDDFASLQHIIYGASPMPQGTMNKALEQLPDVGFIQGYGMTECGLISISPASNHTPAANESGRIRSAGIPGPVQQVRIVDEQNVPVPPGTIGEITLRGPNIMLGYWGKPELTQKTVVDGWLHTGDGGYIDEQGYIFVVDRVKDMIISGGENIYSSEVETVVSQHPSVAQCAVIGIPSDEWGETVHVVIVAQANEENLDTLTIEHLRDFCKEHIAGYKCPRSLTLIDALPISGAGKILKNELRKPYWQGREAQVS
ncbi:long-chain-fatty-acid--CoA ligase [Thalassotalea fonticola]|uniref:Long-chain-fatty-acid--CoA ligase n=1 Tax=Thalassotalea fonticola TaxID=3065649 RepID=A0ABZ0GR39_9GAMM|nr:long-chain-fatty-acid--CoA ligase [Colwelliaceae bacterium S1-1]